MYDLFGKEYEDISTDSLQYIEYYDWDLNGPNAVSDFRIEVKDNENFFLLNKAYVECRFYVTNAAGGDLAGENVSPQNNAVGFFKRWELLFDDAIVESVDDAGVCNTIQSLVYFSDSYSNTIARNQLWYPDTVDGVQYDTELEIGHQAVTDAYDNGVDFTINLYDNIEGFVGEPVNLGHRYRRQITSVSKEFSVHIPIKNVFGFAKSYDKVLKGIKIMLRLTRDSDKNVLLRDPLSGVCGFNINWLSFWIPRVKPNVSMLPFMGGACQGLGKLPNLAFFF